MILIFISMLKLSFNRNNPIFEHTITHWYYKNENIILNSALLAFVYIKLKSFYEASQEKMSMYTFFYNTEDCWHRQFDMWVSNEKAQNKACRASTY